MSDAVMDATQPAANVEIERKAICCAFLGPECADRVFERFEPGDFYLPAHQEVFGLLREWHASRRAMDLELLVDAIKVRFNGRALELSKALLDARDTLEVAVPEWVDQYADRLRELADLRFLRQIGMRAISLAATGRDPRKAFEQLAQDLLNRQVGRCGAQRVRHVSEVMHEIMDRLAASPDVVKGEQILSGFKDLDDEFGPVYAGWLFLITGRPSMGKTALALKMSSNIARASRPVLFESLEMSDREAGERLLAPIARIGSRAIREGEPREAIESAMGQIVKAMGELSDFPLFLQAKRSALSDIRSDAQEIMRRTGKPLGAIFVDRIEKLLDVVRDDDTGRATGKASGRLGDLAKEMGCPVVCLVQLNRECEKRPNKRPLLSDLQNSGELEQNAMRVIGVYRDEVYRPDSKDAGIAELLVLKNMHGKIGTCRVAFRQEFPDFGDLARGVRS